MIEKVAGPWFDSRTSNAWLCSWERHFTLISYSSQAVYPLWWHNLTKDLQKEPKKRCSALVWLDGRGVPGSFDRIVYYSTETAHFKEIDRMIWSL